MIYEIAGTEFHGLWSALLVFFVGIVLLFFSKKKFSERGVIGIALSGTIALGGAYGVWKFSSQSIFNYFDYVNGRMKTKTVSGVVAGFTADGTDRYVNFETETVFKYRTYRNTECMLKDISSLKGVNVGGKIKITYRDPEGKESVYCVLRVEVLNENSP
jgi:hypothetical protein